MPRDFDGASLAEVEDEIRYQRARGGDHVCCPFQCPNCQSQNIRGRDLSEGNMEDEGFACLAIRATLDAFWARSSKTISAHRTEINFVLRYAAALLISHPFPRLGPYPLGHHLGMLQGIMLELRGKEPGKKGTWVSWGTTRQQRKTYTVVWEASPESGGDITLSAGGKGGRYTATCNPTEGGFFQRLTTGMCARIGDVVDQDKAYTLAVVHKLLGMFEAEWGDLGLDMPEASISACMFLLVTCLGGMRGYEAVWTDLATLRYDVGYCEDLEDYSAVSWPIVGRFKSNRGVAGCYMVPISGLTQSGFPFFKWTQRFVCKLASVNRVNGWAFQRPGGARALAADYRANIFKKLEVIQATTLLIEPECEIWDEYGIQRSGRRFFTTQCIIAKVPPHLIELQAQWSADRAKGKGTVQRSMRQTYAEVRNMKEALKVPSDSL